MSIFWKRHSRLIGADSHSIVWTEVADTAARLALSLTSNDDGKVVVQLDNDTVWLVKDYSGPTYIELTGGSGGGGTVTSVFARIGDVTATAGDYTAAEITNVAGGNLVAVTVQAALDELDTEKAPATHTHVLSQITDSGTAAAEDIGVTVGDLPQLEDIGGGTPGLPAVDGSQLTGVAGGGSAITVTDEGGAPLTTDVVSFDFVGTGVTASSVGDDVTVTIAAGSAPIDTVFSRTGTVVAEASDYDASQVDNDSGVTGSFVDDALNTLDTDKAETTDARFPTTDEKGALAGTGTPSGSNRYVVDDDSRMTDAVTSSAVLADNTLVRGDGGSRGAQDSGITVDDSDNVTGLTSIEVDGVNINAVGIDETAAGYFFGGADHGATPSDNVFTGGTSNSSSVKGGSNYTRGGIASGTTSEGGDLNLYGGTGTSGPGGVRVGGFDTTVSASEIEMMKGFSIRESADHPNATVAGRGQLWPRTSDGAIMWTDSSDVDHDLTTSGSGTMEVEDEGTPVTGGPHDTMNFIGGGVTAADAGGGTVSITIAPGAAPVDTVFSRTGTVVAAASDYDASQIDNDSLVTGAFVDDALNQLDTDVTSAQGDATQALSDAAAAQSDATSAKTKTDYLTVTGSIDLDTMDTEVAANNAKVTYDDAATVAGHVTTLANVATPITTAGAALLDDLNITAQRTTLGLGSAAVEDAGVTIGDLVPLENVGGNPGLPAVDGSQLTGIDTGTPISVQDESDPPLTANLNKLTFEGAGVVATEPGTDGEITVTIAGGSPGAIDITDGTTTVNSADKLTFDGTAFDVTDEGGDDALVEPIFNTTAGTIAEGDHTHDTLANIDNTSNDGVILGRDTVGSGLSEELTPAEARAVIGVTLQNLGAGTHSDLESKVPDAGAIFCSSITGAGQIDGLALVTAVAGDMILIEDDSNSFEKRKVDAGDFVLDSEVDADIKTLSLPASTTISAFGATLVDDADAATAIATLGIDTIAGINSEISDGPVSAFTSGAGAPGASSGVANAYYWDTTGDYLYRDTGAVWQVIQPVDHNHLYSSITTVPEYTFLGREIAASGNCRAFDGTAATVMLDAFATTATTQGVVPGSNSLGATYYLDGSGAWTQPAGAVAALADLSDVTATEGTGSTVLFQGSPDITTPTIASFANSAHDHEDAAGGAQLGTNALVDDAVTLAKIDAHTGAVAGVLGYGASGAPSEVSSSATTGHVLKSAGTGAVPTFGALVADSYGTGTIAVTRLANGTDGELVTWSTAGVATTVAAGADGHVLTSKGAGAVPVFQAAPSAPTLTKSITVEDPVTGETISMFYTNVAITVTQITAVIVGSTSVDFNISHGTSRAAVTNDVMSADDTADSTTTGNITTSFGDADIPASSFVALTTSALSGTPTELHVTVEYTED